MDDIKVILNGLIDAQKSALLQMRDLKIQHAAAGASFQTVLLALAASHPNPSELRRQLANYSSVASLVTASSDGDQALLDALTQSIEQLVSLVLAELPPSD
jgi:hypothetical protein